MNPDLKIQAVMADVDSELESLRREREWLIGVEVHRVLEDIKHTLLECSKRFPIQTLPGDNVADVRQKQFKSQRILMSSPNGTGQIKCMVTLKGDSIFEADINFKHKQGKEHHLYKTSILEDSPWKLQQIQDAGNHLCKALSILNSHDCSYKFQSGKEVILLLDDVMKSLMKCRGSLTLPKRKSLQDLVSNRNMHVLYPPVPSDVALSFYIHASKLILSLYHVYINGPKIEVTARYQVETVVQWLNEAIVFFTLALQQCQQLKDKLTVLLQYEGIS